jgi:hypothetical protein
MNNTAEQITALERTVRQLRLEYFHCMDFRIYDRAEAVREKIAAAVAEIAALEAAAA